MTLPTLLKFNVRYYRRHALLSFLCLTGIALGVGIVVAVELINNSALRSLESAVDFLSGKATHSVVSSYSRINEKLFARVWKHPTVEAASPVIEVVSTTLETGQEPIRFIGVDPFLDAEFRSLAPRARSQTDLMKFLVGTTPAAYLSGKLMRRWELKAGDSLTVLTAGIEKKLKIIAALSDSEAVNLGQNLAVLDISAAQEIFGKKGYLDRIDIILTSDAQAFLKDLPAGLRLTDRSAKKLSLKALLYSFQLNLAAMSLLALFVGTFLIYNFSMFSVLSRREDLSLLLTLGSDRRGLVSAFLLESLLLGTAGSLLGIAFGYLIAKLSIDKVSSTISDLYFFLNVETVHLTLPIALIGLAVGYLATLIGTGLPALEVAGVPPIMGMKRRTIEDRAETLKKSLAVAGVISLAGAAAAAWASRYSIFWGFASAFGATLAFALFTPAILSPLAHRMGLWFRDGLGSLEGFIAARTIRASLSRTGIAVAALSVALSMTIGVDTMIHSFRESVRIWVNGILQGDLYISPGTTRWDHPLPKDLLMMLNNDPDVAAMERFSTHNIDLRGKQVRIRVVDAAALQNHSNFHFLKGKDNAWQRLMQGGVFVSESLAYHFGLDIHDRIKLKTPLGERSFAIIAVVRDYSSDQGAMHIDREIYQRIWNDKRVQSVALFLRPGANPENVRRRIVESFPGLNRTIISNLEMKQNVLTIFDKTFAPTATLKGVSLLVALLGVAAALMAIFIERSREMTVLGYLGFTSKQLGKVNVFQALIMGFVAFLISIVCGLIITYIVVHAINYRSFGWSVDISIQPLIFAKTFALTMVACLASSIYPVLKLLKSRNGLSLQEE